MIGIREGHREVCEFLVGRGADVNARDRNGWTCLHHAARPWWRENVDILKLLLDSGADRGALDDSGRTPLDLAGKAGHLEAVGILEIFAP